MADLSTAAALREAIEKYGLTQKQAGAALGVSDRMVRQVLSGSKPGANLRQAANQLASYGRITTPPARREQRVRAPGGETTKPLPPVEKTTTVETGRRAQTTISAPLRGLGREAARDAILTDLRARRGGARGRGGQRVTITVRTKSGRQYTLGGRGGYDPKAVARRMEDDGDPLDWLADEANSLPNCTSAGAVAPGNIVGVTLTYF